MNGQQTVLLESSVKMHRTKSVVMYHYTHGEQNREVLASLTLKPRVEKSDQSFAQVDLAQQSIDEERTGRIIRSMKKALSKSISSISMPEKERPLDPAVDFTYKAKTTFGPAAGSAGGFGICHCSSVRANPPFGIAGEEPPTEEGLYHTEPFTFTDYSPMCYRHIRQFFKVDSKSYEEVLTQSGWHCILTPGKSSAKLFFIGQNWIVKTMTKEESKFLRAILHRYYCHVRDNAYTLLPHFLGHHSITLHEYGEKITFVVMQNVFATTNKIHEKFDLKGSTVGRFATQEERKKLTCCKKDLDINRPILIGSRRRAILLDQVKRDCDFLKKACIMDYSFLLGIHSAPKPEGPSVQANAFDDERCFTSDQGGMRSVSDSDVHEIYYAGIIDILQEYNWWKQGETIVRGISNDSHLISSVDPKEYAARFLAFIGSIVT